MYSGIIANTEAVIRGSYNGLPSTSTCQLTTCHRRCEVETKAASSTSIEHLCIFVLSSSDVCIVEQRREAGAFLRGVPTNKQQSHPLWRLAQSWGTLFKKVCFWDDEFTHWFCISSYPLPIMGNNPITYYTLYMIFVDFSIPPHYLGLKITLKVHKFATK